MFDVPIETLRKRQSEKWRTFPADILPAFVAETDFGIPPAVRAALDRALEIGDTGYAWPGTLAQAFSGFARTQFDWNVDPHRVFQVPDVMAGVAQALLALTPPGAGGIINPPVYAPFFEVLRTIGRSQIDVPLRREESGRWSPDFDALERAFAGGAKAYLLCSPHNPVGRVWSPDDVRRIRELAIHYDVAVVADEIHAPLTLPGSEFAPLLRAASEQVRCVSVMSASKAWNIAGLKCAVLVAGSDDVRETLHRQLHAVPTEIESRVGHLGVHASIAAFRNAEEWLPELRAYLGDNRALRSAGGHLSRMDRLQRLTDERRARAILPRARPRRTRAGYQVRNRRRTLRQTEFRDVQDDLARNRFANDGSIISGENRMPLR